MTEQNVQPYPQAQSYQDYGGRPGYHDGRADQAAYDGYDDIAQPKAGQKPLADRAHRREQKKAQKKAERQFRRQNRSRSLMVRRFIAMAIMLGIAFTIYYVLFHTTAVDPLLAMLGPAQEWIAWVKADPARLFGAATLLIVPYLGMYSFFFERRG